MKARSVREVLTMLTVRCHLTLREAQAITTALLLCFRTSKSSMSQLSVAYLHGMCMILVVQKRISRKLADDLGKNAWRLACGDPLPEKYPRKA